MGSKASKTSGRTKILEVFARHPEGLNAAKLRKLVLNEYAVSEDALVTALTKFTREGKLRSEGKCECSQCALRSVVYRLNKDSG